MTRTQRPDEAARAMARLLAELLSSEAGAPALRQLRTPATPSRPTAAEVLDVLAGGTRPPLRQVGIWASLDAGENSELIRRDEMAGEWRLWADVERIPARRTRPRVLLLGESVARGYFYDPVATPASLLEQMLSSAGGGEVEVVDLARTDAAISDLARLAGEIAALEPDALVLFAGNNWHQVGAEPDELAGLATALRGGGLSRAWDLLTTRAVAQGGTVLDMLGLVARLRSLPVVIVVPEFNLVGWHPRATQDPLLPRDRRAAWLLAREQGRLALAEQRNGDVSAAAARLLELDGGTIGESWFLLAQARRRLGDELGARPALEEARDAPSGQIMPDTPRCSRIVQGLLRAKAAQHGFALVDLPKLLAADSAAGSPDPTKFLDYCHLTWDGLTVAMGETASRLAVPLLGVGHSGPWFVDRASSPSDRDQAVARYLAAVHHARLGQPRETVRTRCAEALRVSPTVARMMERYVDFRIRKAPDWLCSTFREAVADPAVARYLETANADAAAVPPDFDLVATTIDVLAADGIEIESHSRKLLCAEHGLGLEDSDLLLDHSRATASGAAQPSVHFRANATPSRFHLVVGEPVDVRLGLTCRLPCRETAAPAVLAVNDRPIGEIELDERWRTVVLRVAAEGLVEGLNVVTVHWPTPTADACSVLDRAADTARGGEIPDLALPLGEIAAFAARLDPTDGSELQQRRGLGDSGA